MPNKLSLNNILRENAKNALKPLKLKLTRNLKHMTIDFDSNNFNTTIYTKYCCLLSFMPNKQSFNYLMRESAKNASKTFKTPYST